jgi:hypothetical protein
MTASRSIITALVALVAAAAAAESSPPAAARTDSTLSKTTTSGSCSLAWFKPFATRTLGSKSAIPTTR